MNDPLLTNPQKPNVTELAKIFQECSPLWNGWDRLGDNDNIRYTVWEGQSSDGRKWDKNMADGRGAFPWDGASDCRVPMADEIVNDMVDILTESFWRAVAQVQAVGIEDVARASLATKMLDWMRNSRLYPSLVTEVELHSQNGQTYGGSVLHAFWEREVAWKRKRIDIEMMAMGAQQLGIDPDALQELILNPIHETQVIELIQTMYSQHAAAMIPDDLDWTPPELSKSKARAFLKEIRATGESSLAVPYVCKNQPAVRALKLWEEVYFPPETTDIQADRVIYAKEWLTESELRSRALVEEWDPKWVEEAITQKGKFSSWTQHDTDAAITKLTAEFGYVEYGKKDLIEVLTAYTKRTDEDGVLGVWVTVFHGAFSTADGADDDLAAAHYLLPCPSHRYPFSLYRREIPVRRVCASRGVPQIVSTWQRTVKVQEDAITDQTSLGVLPPIITPNLEGQDYKYGPAVQIPVTNKSMAPEFMNIPRGGAVVAFDLWDRIERRADRYFGRPRADLPPEVALRKQQKQARAFLLSWSQAFQLMFMMMLKYMSPAEMERLLGSVELLDLPEEEIEQQFDYVLNFDVQELNPDYAGMKLKAISESVLPEDVVGVVDRAKLTRLKLRAIDPSYEKELVQDDATASQALFDKVRTDFAMMALGNAPNYVENDPTAPMQLRFADQIVSMNPKYQMMLQSDQHFQELVKKWSQNMQFSLQQQENKQIGRIGVSPNQQSV